MIIEIILVIAFSILLGIGGVLVLGLVMYIDDWLWFNVPTYRKYTNLLSKRLFK